MQRVCTGTNMTQQTRRLVEALPAFEFHVVNCSLDFLASHLMPLLGLGTRRSESEMRPLDINSEKSWLYNPGVLARSRRMVSVKKMSICVTLTSSCSWANQINMARTFANWSFGFFSSTLAWSAALNSNVCSECWPPSWLTKSHQCWPRQPNNKSKLFPFFASLLRPSSFRDSLALFLVTMMSTMASTIFCRMDGSTP